jgi:hypothetical protein
VTDKREAEQWKARQDLESAGYEPRFENGVFLHGCNESAKHAHVKLALARVLQEKRGSDGWDTEVQGPSGRVDVLDLGPVDGRPVVYEVETGARKQRVREKVDQYVVGPVRDVIVLDPLDAPDDVRELQGWVEGHVVG